MRRKITLFMIFLFVCFTCGAVLTSVYINKTISEFNHLVELHQIEDLRKNLVIRIQTVQSDLFTVRTPLAHKLDSIVSNVSNLEQSAQGCIRCHHIPEVSNRLNNLLILIKDYQNALSYYITASANAEMVDQLKSEAAAIGSGLLIKTEEMSFDSSRRLRLITKTALEKVNKAKTILFGTLILTFFFSIIVVIKTTRGIIHPVNELVNATRNIASGNLGYTISYKDKTEFGELANNFNTMSLALKEGYNKLQNEINERKKVEEELIKVQKLESLGILAGGIAHDFNNLLTAILGNIDLVKVDLHQEDEIYRRLQDAENASLRARDLTRQLLTFSRGGEPVKKTIIISSLLKNSASFALSGSNVTCELSIPDKLWPADVDEGQISQVIHNLVINAREAMSDGGRIRIHAENISIDSDDDLPLEKGKYIKISVEDSGVGISEENLLRIFDPYFTTKEMGVQKGMGLGLAISYSIIRNHNGYISVNSEVAKGTAFNIYIPASKEKISEAKMADKKIIAGKGKILFMDDEEVVRKIACKILKRLGYTSEFAKDGAEAIELYKKAKQSSHPFDAVIMDLTVPGNMGGKEAIQRLLEIDPDVKAIVSSGYSNNSVITNFREHGFREFIAKPYTSSEMSKVLCKVITD